jgi:hypothetical protein
MEWRFAELLRATPAWRFSGVARGGVLWERVREGEPGVPGMVIALVEAASLFEGRGASDPFCTESEHKLYIHFVVSKFAGTKE